MKLFLLLLFVNFSFAQSFQTYAYQEKELKSFEKYEDLATYLQPNDNELLVINFWATWCEPCVEEIPYFNQMFKEMKTDNVRLIFVSLDFSRHIDKRLIPFLNQNEMLGEALHLADSKQNHWIDLISKDWSGAIPATWFLSKKTNYFFEGELTYENLIKFVNNFKI